MSRIKWEKDQSVAVLTMDNGANKMDLEFAEQMVGTLDQILEDEAVKAVVMASSDEKNWSQGIDLEWLGARWQDGDLDMVRKFVFGMNEVFKKLLLYPAPVIAAINGHAFGNGAIMACACDFRFMREDKGFFCFPEVDVSIPFLPGMNMTVKKAIPYYKLQEMQLTGKRVAGPELAEHHVVMEACPADELMPRALAFARTFDKKRPIFGEMKKRMYKDVIQVIDTEDPPIIQELKLMM